MPTRLYSYYYPLLSSLLVLGSGASEQHQLSSQPPLFALEEEEEECGIYLAQSTIANAGFGLFAGKDYSKNELLLQAPSHGDIVIPIVDFKFHSVDQREFYFLWNDYVWASSTVTGLKEDGKYIKACSPGLGAAANHHSGLANIEFARYLSSVDTADLHRSRDPGVGAFSPFHNQHFGVFGRDIKAGDELFLDYGDRYFTARTRKDKYHGVPLKKDFEQADALLDRFAAVQQIFNNKTIAQHLWSVVARFPWQSRATNVLPTNYSDIDDSLLETGVRLSRLDLNHLKRHGKCLDNIRPGKSKIPQAGRGAFAARFIQAGGLVSSSPLIHIQDRKLLNMYDYSKFEDEIVRVLLRNRKPNTPIFEKYASKPKHQQLLLNYCFGHSQSTALLLCPYGMYTSYINHSHKRPNARIFWSDKMQHPEWMDVPVEDFGNLSYAGLSVDYVALRNISVGEEILIDYGKEWESAWKKHSNEWRPPKDAHLYRSATDLNNDLILRTIYEGGYRLDDVRLYCHEYNRVISLGWRPKRLSRERRECEILDRYKVGNVTLYMVAVVEINDDFHNQQTNVDRQETLFNFPREAFYFEDVAYSRDHSMPWSFRHEMMIPNDMLPAAWKNK